MIFHSALDYDCPGQDFSCLWNLKIWTTWRQPWGAPFIFFISFFSHNMTFKIHVEPFLMLSCPPQRILTFGKLKNHQNIFKSNKFLKPNSAAKCNCPGIALSEHAPKVVYDRSTSHFVILLSIMASQLQNLAFLRNSKFWYFMKKNGPAFHIFFCFYLLHSLN